MHPDLKESTAKEVVFDQKGCRFVPHAIVARTDQVVRVKSNDKLQHNTHTYPARNKGMNILMKPVDREGQLVAYQQPEVMPFQVKCDVHTWMTAYWLIVDHPYAAITDAQGRFTIEKLPAGEQEFRVWHERPKYLERSRKAVIRSGETTDLGTIKVPLAKLAVSAGS